MNTIRKLLALVLALILSLSLPGVAMGVEPPAPEIPTVPEEPEKIELTMIWNYDLAVKGCLIPVGDNEAWEEEIRSRELFFRFIAGYNENEDEAELTLETLDTSAVDLLTPGTYTVTVVLKLMDESAEKFTISDEVRTLRIPVYVCDPERFNIRIKTMTNFAFHFTYLTPLDEEPSILWADSDQPLEDDALESANWQPCPETVAYTGVAVGRILRNKLALNRHYYFRLQSGERYSDILYILDDGTTLSYDSKGGDRDGGDTEGNKPLSVILPPPTTTPPSPDDSNDSSMGSVEQIPAPSPAPALTPKPEKPMPPLKPLKPMEPTTSTPASPASPTSPTNPPVASAAPAAPQLSEPPFTEEFGETYSRLSGARLRFMEAADGTVRFSKQGVAITLSGATVAALAVPERGVFSIEIIRADNHTFSIAVAVNDLAVGALPATRVTLPYAAAGDAPVLTLRDAEGQTVASGSYDAARQLAAFTVDAAGSYSIVEEVATVTAAAAPITPTESPVQMPPLPTPVGAPIAPIAIGGICLLLLACGGVFLGRRGRGK